MEMYYHTLAISELTIRIKTDIQLRVQKEFLPFLVQTEKPDYTAVFQCVDALPPIPGEILHEDNCYRVHPDGKGGYIRSFFDAPRDRAPYAVARFDDRLPGIRVDYLSKGLRCVSELQNSFFHVGFESLLIRSHRLCLHAACVDTPLGGILFSGPSGIGKSTQAALWQSFRSAKQINGDRPILEKRAEGWKAWGSPYAGSSHCHVNESCDVKAIVMLKQAAACDLRRLPLPRAFRAVWSGLTMNSWDEAAVTEASTLAMELIEAVPVYEFACTPDEQAVAYLEAALRKDLQ